MKYVLILIILLQLSCQSTEDKIDKRIMLFNEFGDKYFDSTYIRIMRELKNPKRREFEVRKVGGDFKGFMQSSPEKYWHHNGDTMNVEFIEVFSKFDCWYLYNFEGCTCIEFLDNKKRVIVFKGIPNNKGISCFNKEYYIENFESREFRDGWKYIIVDYKDEN